MTSLQSVLRTARRSLETSGIDNAGLDARLLVAWALRIRPAELQTFTDRDVTPAEERRITAAVTRRAAREPIGRIQGVREFWSLPFGLNDATLEPRPDSETLIEVACHTLNGRKGLQICDLGTGSGCLLLSLLTELPDATGLGIDCAREAVLQAERNATVLGLDGRAKFRVGDWLGGTKEHFDVILANPPYIATPQLGSLMPEVRDFDPILALDGGPDGLKMYRHLIPQLPARLKRGGHVFLEIGQGQGDEVSRLLIAQGFDMPKRHRDLAGIERCLEATTA